MHYTLYHYMENEILDVYNIFKFIFILYISLHADNYKAIL